LRGEAITSRFQQHLRVAPCDVEKLQGRVGWRSGAALPSLHGSRADVEKPGEGDLGNSKVSSDLGHLPRSKLWQRTELDFARRQGALPPLVRDRVLEPLAELVER